MDFLTLGTYAGVPVEWQILDKQYDKMLLLSRYVLDAKVFFPDCIYTSWERSTLRTWMNTELYQMLFSPEEQTRILETEIFTPDCTGFDNYGANYTKDKLFILSREELNHYLPSPDSRTTPAEPNAIKVSQDLRDFVRLLPFYKEVRNCWWWLRTPGDEPNNMCIVWADGSVFDFQHYVNYERGIRPAVYIRTK